MAETWTVEHWAEKGLWLHTLQVDHRPPIAVLVDVEMLEDSDRAMFRAQEAQRNQDVTSDPVWSRERRAAAVSMTFTGESVVEVTERDTQVCGHCGGVHLRQCPHCAAAIPDGPGAHNCPAARGKY